VRRRPIAELGVGLSLFRLAAAAQEEQNQDRDCRSELEVTTGLESRNVGLIDLRLVGDIDLGLADRLA